MSRRKRVRKRRQSSFAPRAAEQHGAQVRAGASPAGGRVPADMTHPTQGRGAAWLVVVMYRRPPSVHPSTIGVNLHDEYIVITEQTSLKNLRGVVSRDLYCR